MFDYTKLTADQPRQLKHRETTDNIIREFYAVYNELGHGFLESVYRGALILALSQAGCKVDREVELPVLFRGCRVGQYYADIIVDGVVIVELKVATSLDRSHLAQLLHYLKATEIEVGILLNFGPKPEFKRLLLDNERKRIRANPCESVVRF